MLQGIYLPATLGGELVSGKRAAECLLLLSCREMNHLTWSVVTGEHLLLFFCLRTQAFSHPVHLQVLCFSVFTASPALHQRACHPSSRLLF